MSVPVALKLRQLLEAEGAWFNPSIVPAALCSMGGGMGLSYRPIAADKDTSITGKQKKATLLEPSYSDSPNVAKIPYKSMITTQKARRNIALIEVELERLRCRSDATASIIESENTLKFTANGLEDLSSLAEAEQEQLNKEFWYSVAEKEQQLKKWLDPTNTITCYLLLMSFLFNRWEKDEICESSAKYQEGATQTVIKFSHENNWMETWIKNLPPQYDNLLELNSNEFFSITGKALAEDFQNQNSDMEKSNLNCVHLNSEQFSSSLFFERFCEKARDEQMEMIKRFIFCHEKLEFLRNIPIGVYCDAAENAGTGSSDSRTRHGASRCTLRQFCWAYNSLLSRGFNYDIEIWTMIPFVDYFNYALAPNSTMSLCTTTPGVGKKRGLKLTESQYYYAFYTIGVVRPGEQFLIHYGAYSDFELLMWYGFCLRSFLLPITETNTRELNEIFREETGPATDGNGATSLLQQASAVLRPPQHYVWQLLPLLWRDRHRRALWSTWWANQEGLLAQDNCNADSAAVNNEETKSESTMKAEYIESLKKLDKKVDQVKETGLFSKDLGYLLEVSYNDWCESLRCCFSYPFSPLADTDGVYPTQNLHHTWLDALVDSFYAKYITSENENPDSPSRTESAITDYSFDGIPPSVADSISRADMLAITFALLWRNTNTRDALQEKEELLEEDLFSRCKISVFGPTDTLRSLCQEIHERIVSKCSGNAKKVLAEPVNILQAIAWMELRSNFDFKGVEKNTTEKQREESSKHLCLNDFITEKHMEQQQEDSIENEEDDSPTERELFYSVTAFKMASQVSRDAVQLLLSVSLFNDDGTNAMEELFMENE